MTTLNQHWNAIFSTKTDPELGWYESDVSQTLKFLDLIPQREPATIFLPGAGTSVLVDELLTRGHKIILNDISDKALNKLKNRIGTDEDRLIFIHHDISKPLLASIQDVVLTLIESILLVACVTLLFLGSLRTTLVPLVTIPVCLVGALGLLYLMGFTLNTMTLLALVLGKMR